MIHSDGIAKTHGGPNRQPDDEVMTIALERPSAGISGDAARIATDRGVPVLDVVVPVYNEQAALADSVRRLHRHLSEQFPFTFRITIADNASVDATPAIAAGLADEFPEVRVRRLEQKGRGRALHTVWENSDAPVLAYMDVDLSTDLAALLPLVAPLISGHSDVAIGTRLSRGSRVVRGPKRELISRCYNLILRSTLAARFSDAQCGFKAIRADVAQALLPHISDTGWFFDTELLVLAERSGLRIHEVPVDWVDDPDSRVDIVSTAIADLKGVARLLRGFGSGDIPVGAIWFPHFARMAKSGGKVLCTGKDAGATIISNMVVRSDYLKDNLDAVARFAAMYLRAMNVLREDKARALASMKRLYDQGGVVLSPEEMDGELTSRDYWSLADQTKAFDRKAGESAIDQASSQMAAFLKSTGTIQAIPDPKTYINPVVLDYINQHPDIKAFAEGKDVQL